jgi:hypothetical protein
MTTKSIPDSKSTTTAAPVASSDCCGGKTAAGSRHEPSKVVDHEGHKHAAPTKATNSCCCGNTQEVKP